MYFDAASAKDAFLVPLTADCKTVTDEDGNVVYEEKKDANGNTVMEQKKDENGDLAGIWGAMSDFSLSFRPWEEGFSKGLYLAGVECEDEAHNRQPLPIGNPRHPAESWHPRTG